MTDGLAEVPLVGERDCPADAGQIAFVSGYPFDETLVRLRGAIEAEDLWVLHEIDPQMLLRRGGFAIPAVRQILYFHPRYMARLLSTNAAAVVEAPLKFVVAAASAGGVLVRYPEPEFAFGRYARLAELGGELSAVAGRIASMVAAVGEPPIC